MFFCSNFILFFKVLKIKFKFFSIFFGLFFENEEVLFFILRVVVYIFLYFWCRFILSNLVIGNFVFVGMVFFGYWL